jgi:hypothetical protein
VTRGKPNALRWAEWACSAVHRGPSNLFPDFSFSLVCVYLFDVSVYPCFMEIAISPYWCIPYW